jgi:hypothetical protein
MPPQADLADPGLHPREEWTPSKPSPPPVAAAYRLPSVSQRMPSALPGLMATMMPFMGRG